METLFSSQFETFEMLNGKRYFYKYFSATISQGARTSLFTSAPRGISIMEDAERRAWVISLAKLYTNMSSGVTAIGLELF